MLNGHKWRTESVSMAEVTQGFVSPREDKGASPYTTLKWSPLSLKGVSIEVLILQ